MFRFSWAAGVFGASQLARLGSSVGGNGGREKALDSVTWAARGQLGELLQAAFQAGGDLQEDAFEVLADALAPSRWPQVASRLAGSSLDTLRIARPDQEGALARQELKNKLEVFSLVKGVRRRLGHPPPGVPFELAPYVAKAYELDAYRAAWLVEGLGHDYAQTALEQDGAPRGLLCGDAVASLPAISLPMLHGGLGLAFAEHVLASLAPASSGQVAGAALERFALLCRANSTARHADSAIESLGLDARCFFPDLVPALERGLMAIGDAELRRFFWHGAGRALYFVPVNFIPGYGSLWHAVAMAEREAPDATMRHAALAGVAYAFTMVNLAQPAILESALRARGERLRGTAFADGVAAAVAMRHQVTPESEALGRLAAHRPVPAVAQLWQEMVGEPCRRALRDEPAAGDWRDREAATVYRSLS